MNIVITSSNIQFKNPQVGQPTRAVEEHYYGRRIMAMVDGGEKLFRFKKDEMPFDIDEDGMVEMIEDKIVENKMKQNVEESV